MVQVGNVDLHFPDTAALEACIDAERLIILKIEQERLSHDPRDLSAWREVEHHAAMLSDLLGALGAWIATEEADLDREIEAARQSIRKLGDTAL